MYRQQWTAGGPVGPAGVVVHREFAREISVFEQELAVIPYHLKMENIVMKETVHSKWTA